jgi:transcriptional regulator with XRE-family HTH domain
MSVAVEPPQDSTLGAYLKDRRARLDALALGFPAGRRRTAGLRREEVAQRAGISATWYTWLEQGRGGAPSAEALDRIARALVLTEVEREHLFLLGLGRPPQTRIDTTGGVTPRLQRVLEALEPAPALVQTLLWDVVAWNRAAAVVLTDYAAVAPSERNILRRIFCHPNVRAMQHDWDRLARFVVAAFRADAARMGDTAEVRALVEELSTRSPDFAALWREHDVRHYGEGVKRLNHPTLGDLSFDYSAFRVDERPDLSMVVYNPSTPEDARRVATALATVVATVVETGANRA